MSITFLGIDEIHRIHQDQIARYGGALGVRDEGLLTSAIAQPSASFAGTYLHPTIQEMAAAYLYHLVQNHPFVDGNKRVGAVASLMFLAMNDHELNASEHEFEKLVLNVASGQIDKPQIADFFRQNTKHL
jgi:death on curing protein